MVRRLPALALLLAAALVAGGCHSNRAPRTAPRPPAAATYSGIVASHLHIVRVPFCDLVPTRALTRAIGGAPHAALRWGNGARIPGVAGADIGHELGCAWTGPAGVVARAWVFARPVTAAFAASIVAAAHQPSCSDHPNPVFGKPAVTQVCSAPSHSLRVRHAGLFGDTWLSCDLQAPRESEPVLLRRTDAWCAAVVSALDTTG